MSTNPALPDILRGAAAQVDELVAELSAQRSMFAAQLVLDSFAWSGDAAKAWAKTERVLDTRAVAQLRQARTLAATLRAAAASAAGRIDAERVAAQRAAAAAVAAQKAAQQAAQARKGT